MSKAILTYIIIVGTPFIHTFPALADENDVSPKLAKKAAVYEFTRAWGRSLSERYDHFLISEPSVINSYDGDLKWYVFYITVGLSELPTRGELEVLARNQANLVNIDNGIIYTMIIPADTTRPVTWGSMPGMPIDVDERYQTEENIKKRMAPSEIKFVKVFGVLTQIGLGRAAFEYEVDGERYAVFSNTYQIVKTSTLKTTGPDPRAEIHKLEWARIEESLPSGLIEDDEIYFNELEDILAD
jgi:hypothetical protein